MSQPVCLPSSHFASRPACEYVMCVNLSLSHILGAQNASPCMTHWLLALHSALARREASWGSAS